MATLQESKIRVDVKPKLSNNELKRHLKAEKKVPRKEARQNELSEEQLRGSWVVLSIRPLQSSCHREKN